jgi:hypothetical protein
MSEVFKNNRVTVRHESDGRTLCVNRTDLPFKVGLLDGTEIVVAPWTEFVGTREDQTHTPLERSSDS